MARPPASSESGEHILDLASYAVQDDVDTERRDSGDRISFNSIARLVKPSLPPRSFDSLSPVARTDVPPAPGVPGPSTTRVRGRSRGGLLLKVVSALGAVALGAGLAAALQADGRAAATQPVTAAAAPRAESPEDVPAAAPAEPTAPAPRLEAPLARPPEPNDAVADEPAPVEVERAAHDHARERREREREEERASRDRREPAADHGERPGRVAETAVEAPAAPRPEASAAAGTERPGAAGAIEAAEPDASPADLPEHPSREAVQRTMAALLPAVRGCAAGQGGTVEVEVTAGSSGRVRNALVTGAFAGTPEGSCMARAVRGARFPRFGQESFTVRYPFRL